MGSFSSLLLALGPHWVKKPFLFTFEILRHINIFDISFPSSFFDSSISYLDTAVPYLSITCQVLFFLRDIQA
jgi:hypothetical protein